MTLYSIALICAAGMIPTLVGALWYHPRLFGEMWLRFVGVTPQMAEIAQRYRRIYSIYSLATGIALSGALYVLLDAMHIIHVLDAIIVALGLVLFILVPTSIGDVLWEQKQPKLYAIDTVYWTIVLIIVASTVSFAL
ncbi:DUF1761 domain-containing protein [Candidatus Kaiserbacteria bacterium]|nr:DUF1761 domain-containing protein [Candidatus Kaiserbacteria bacterium]